MRSKMRRALSICFFVLTLAGFGCVVHHSADNVVCSRSHKHRKCCLLLVFPTGYRCPTLLTRREAHALDVDPNLSIPTQRCPQESRSWGRLLEGEVPHCASVPQGGAMPALRGTHNCVFLKLSCLLCDGQGDLRFFCLFLCGRSFFQSSSRRASHFLRAVPGSSRGITSPSMRSTRRVVHDAGPCVCAPRAALAFFLGCLVACPWTGSMPSDSHRPRLWEYDIVSHTCPLSAQMGSGHHWVVRCPPKRSTLLSRTATTNLSRPSCARRTVASFLSQACPCVPPPPSRSAASTTARRFAQRRSLTCTTGTAMRIKSRRHAKTSSSPPSRQHVVLRLGAARFTDRSEIRGNSEMLAVALHGAKNSLRH